MPRLGTIIRTVLQAIARNDASNARVEASLSLLHRKIDMADKNLDQIVSDWPKLQTAVAALMSKITDLSGQLANTPADDPRAAQLHNEIVELTQKANDLLAPAPGGDAAAAQPSVGAGTSAGSTAPGATASAGLNEVPPNV